MEKIVVFHNPACSKSRGTLDLLRERGIACDVVEYLTSPPDRATILRILALLGGPPTDLVRHDDRFRALGLDAAAHTTRDDVAALLVEHPELMQRPVVVRGERAVIARPPERLLVLLDS